MLTSKGKYALRAAAMLTEDFALQRWTPTAEIAEREHIPRKFLETILIQMRDPATISAADVMRLIDGPLALTPCASVTRFRPCTDCVDINACRLQHLMREARDAVANILENRSLVSLVRPD
jgi:DNA-binding IscR family transcriptional regulator